MDNRKKQEDLEAEVDEILEETPEETAEVAEPSEETPQEDTPEVEDREDDTPEEPVKTEPDYREKFKASTQEAHVLHSKNTKFTESVEQAAQLAEVDETELKAKYPNWDDLNDFEKGLAKENLVAQRRFEMVHNAVLETKKVDVWAEKVSEFLMDDTQVNAYPGLAGREDDFKSFATKPSRVGVDLGDLVSAFLYTTPAPSKAKKGSLLLSGGSSGEFDNKPKRLNEEDAAVIRAKSPKEYMRLIKEGKIDIEI